MKRLTLLMVAAGLLASACGARGPSSLGSVPTGSEPSPSMTTSPEPTKPRPTQTPSNPAPSGRTFTFEVWFERDGKLFLTSRTEPFIAAVAQRALDSLVGGPFPAEAGAGVETSLPSNATADITDLAGGVASVEVSDSFFGEEGPAYRMRQAQVVYTLTQYSTISKVRFEAVTVELLENEWSRDDFDDILPAIVVESPVIGERVDDPVTISGTANVFEATVSIRILDQDGDEIARTFTTATCGTGCRGDYSIVVSYEVGREQPGTVEVFESSARDGSPINLQSIPVILRP